MSEKTELPSQALEALAYMRTKITREANAVINLVTEFRETLEFLHKKKRINLGQCMSEKGLDSDVLLYEPGAVHPLVTMIDHLEWARTRLWEADQELDQFLGEPEENRLFEDRPKGKTCG